MARHIAIFSAVLRDGMWRVAHDGWSSSLPAAK